MNKKSWGAVVVTHLTAIAVGAIVASSQSADDSTPSGTNRSTTRTNRVEPRTKISAQELLAAYYNSLYSTEAIQRRNHTQKRISDEQLTKTPEELAATVSDFRSYMNEARTRMDIEMHSSRDPLYTWRTTSLVLKKWLSIDPDNALAWLGSTDFRTFWADLYKEPLEGLYADNPLAYYKLISNGWNQRNRNRAIKILAQYCASSKPEHVPILLSAISQDHQKDFLTSATAAARPEDWRMWLGTLKDMGWSESWHLQTARTAAQALMQFSTGKQAKISDQILDAVSGTELEAIFKKQYALSKSNWNERMKSSQLSQLTRDDPVAAYSAWVKFKQESGMSPAEAKEWALRQSWGRKLITPHLQRVLVGELSVGEALQEASKKTASAPPELIQSINEEWYFDALTVAPGETIRYALAHNSESALRAAFGKLVNRHDRSGYQKRILLVQAMDTRLWGSDPSVKTSLGQQLKDYYKEEPQAAITWAQSLPTVEQQKYASEIIAQLHAK